MELRDTGGVADRWRLQEDETGAASDWQPVEYSRPPKTRPSWIVPTLATVALVAVVGYAAWVGITRFDLGVGNLLPGEQADTTPAAEDVADAEPTDSVAVNPEQEQATEPAVAPTEPAATPTTAATEAASPTATVELVEQRIATITNQYGVNARSEPTLDSEVIRILEQDETVVILQEQEDPAIDGNWLEVRLSEGALAWISSSFVETSTQFVPATEAGTVAIDPSDPVTTAALVDDTAPDAAAGDEVETDDTPATAPTAINVTISSTFGLNARTAPEPDAEIVDTLPNQGTYPADLRTEDGQWVRVEVDDGTQAWIFTEFVAADGDLSTLPTEEAVAVEPVAEPDSTEPDTTESVTDTVAAPETEAVTTTEETGLTVVVSSTFGTNARATADTTANVLRVIPNGAEVTALARTSDSEWLQIELDDGRSAWIFTATVVTTPEEVATLPVVTPPALATDTLGSDGGDTDSSEATATVVSLIGTNARPQPDTSGEVVQAVPNGAVLPVLGRSADNQWVQVELEDGTQAWLFENNVDLSVELESLSIVE